MESLVAVTEYLKNQEKINQKQQELKKLLLSFDGETDYKVRKAFRLLDIFVKRYTNNQILFEEYFYLYNTIFGLTEKILNKEEKDLPKIDYSNLDEFNQKLLERYFYWIEAVSQKIQTLESTKQAEIVNLLKEKITNCFFGSNNFNSEKLIKNIDLELLKSLFVLIDFTKTRPELKELNNQVKYLLVYILNPKKENYKLNLEIKKHLLKKILIELKRYQKLENQEIQRIIKLLIVMLAAIFQLLEKDFICFDNRVDKIPTPLNLPTEIITDLKQRRDRITNEINKHSKGKGSNQQDTE